MIEFMFQPNNAQMLNEAAVWAVALGGSIGPVNDEGWHIVSIPTNKQHFLQGIRRYGQTKAK